MTSSTRRLATIPSVRRKDVDLATLTTAFRNHHQALGHSKDTIDHYEDSLRLLRLCLESHGLTPTTDNLTSATMNAFAGWLRETPTRPWRGKSERSVWGVHGALKDVKAFLRWSASEEYIDRVPKVPVPRLPQRLFPILTDDELDRVFASSHLSSTSEVSIRNRALVSLMADTGIRLSEAAGITYADINVKAGSVLIRGKGSKERLVYFADGVAESLRRWLSVRGDDPGSLFWLRSGGIRMLFKRIQTEAGLAVFTPHQLRHTAFTSMVKQNVDLHTIKRIAGHASVTTTEAYLSLAGEDIRAKHSAASPFDRIKERMEPQKPGKRRLKTS